MPKLPRTTPFIDPRGFLWIPHESWGALVSLEQRKYLTHVDLYIDVDSQSVRFEPAWVPKGHSFRLLPKNGGHMLYVAGALKVVNMPVSVQEVGLLNKNNSLVICGLNNSDMAGNWKLFACRTSTTQAYASIDARGTLTLHAHTTSLLGDFLSESAVVNYDENTKILRVDFVDDGDLLVRKKGNLVSLSLMGTLHSYGLNLPIKTVRVLCLVEKNRIEFSFDLP